MASAATLETPPGLVAPVDSDALYEIVDGERREIPHMGLFAGAIASVLVHYLNAFAIPRKLGLAMVEILCRLRPDRPQRRPDISFFSYDRWHFLAAPEDDPPSFDGAPNLAIEVISPSNGVEEIVGKILEYFDAGVELVWVVHPRHRRVYVHEPKNQVRLLAENDELDGGKVLPGFRLSMATLFAPLLKPQ
jgi:Uma2 family endonuclease